MLKLIAPSTSIARQVLDIARMSEYVEIRDAVEG
jgi:hypothetical protein